MTFILFRPKPRDVPITLLLFFKSDPLEKNCQLKAVDQKQI